MAVNDTHSKLGIILYLLSLDLYLKIVAVKSAIRLRNLTFKNGWTLGTSIPKMTDYVSSLSTSVWSGRIGHTY